MEGKYLSNFILSFESQPSPPFETCRSKSMTWTVCSPRVLGCCGHQSNAPHVPLFISTGTKRGLYTSMSGVPHYLSDKPTESSSTQRNHSVSRFTASVQNEISQNTDWDDWRKKLTETLTATD